MRYRPDVDGLRSLAILPILLFHAGVTLFSGGYIGVDIFFVISGFLITTIIRDDLAAGRFSIVTFYERRARRILPALFFTLALTTLAAVILFLPAQLIDYAKSLFGTATFTANFYFWKNSGYFEASAHLRPLLHTLVAGGRGAVLSGGAGGDLGRLALRAPGRDGGASDRAGRLLRAVGLHDRAGADRQLLPAAHPRVGSCCWARWWRSCPPAWHCGAWRTRRRRSRASGSRWYRWCSIPIRPPSPAWPPCRPASGPRS